MTAAELRAEVAKLERGYRGHRYPTSLRRRIVALATARRPSGASWRKIGAEVGIRAETLRRWCTAGADSGRKSSRGVESRGIVPSPERGASDVPHGIATAKTPSLVPIHVVGEVAHAEVALAEVTLVSPAGWRVEGLDLKALTTLLRSLA